MRAPHESIVAGGDRRYRQGRGYKAIRASVFAEVSQRFEGEKANASFWRRCWIEVLIRREVRARMQREFPSGSLHVCALVSENG